MMPTGVAELIPDGPNACEPNRRTRLAAETDPRLRGWLHRTARLHAHLAMIVRLYGRPSRAGGESNAGAAYGERAASGDPSILYDALTVVVDEATELRSEVSAVMDDVEPTPHLPGTPAKVEVLAKRFAIGRTLFVPADARANVE